LGSVSVTCVSPLRVDMSKEETWKQDMLDWSKRCGNKGLISALEN
jgi:hypothetical protein